jgi:hypothetical protein
MYIFRPNGFTKTQLEAFNAVPLGYKWTRKKIKIILQIVDMGGNE